MEYKDFTKRDDAYNIFVKYRREVLDSVDTGKFADTFTELCTKALSGDCVAQDCVSYFFKNGVDGCLFENYEYYMSWQILAGANGNEFALEKMEFFLNPALNAIVYDEEILTEAFRKKNLEKDSAIMVISNLLCEGIVDYLKIDPKQLIQIESVPKPYSAKLQRMYSDALRESAYRVAEYLVT